MYNFVQLQPLDDLITVSRDLTISHNKTNAIETLVTDSERIVSLTSVQLITRLASHRFAYSDKLPLLLVLIGALLIDHF